MTERVARSTFAGWKVGDLLMKILVHWALLDLVFLVLGRS